MDSFADDFKRNTIEHEEKLRAERELMLSRQAELVALPEPNTSMTFIGVGGIGSNALHMAVSMGITDITIVDPDDIGHENVFPGAFPSFKVGEKKVSALMDDMVDYYNVYIDAMPCKLADASLKQASIVVVSTDSNVSRRQAWAKRDYLCYPNSLWIDARMGGYLSTVLTVSLADKAACDTYTEFIQWETDGSLPCGQKATAPLTKGFIAGMIGQSIMRYLNRQPPLYIQRYDLGMALHLTVAESG